ncbi:hypothetical protein ACWDE0_21915 [Streptomyces sp. 900105755]
MTSTDLDLDTIEARAAHLYEHATTTVPDVQDDFDRLAGTDVPALVAEVRRLRAAMEQIRHLHKDSPMGPCPVCIDADAAAAGGDGLVPYPCPTGRLAGAEDCDPPHVRAARYEAAGDVMAASLVRDGFGDEEIANMLGPGVAAGEAPEPTLLRWGLNDVMWGDDDTVTVLLSDEERKPYWLELQPDRAAVLRADLAGPDGDPRAALLRDAENYLSALHGSVARHDNLAANLGCAGCELRDKIRAALAVPAAGETSE